MKICGLWVSILQPSLLHPVLKAPSSDSVEILHGGREELIPCSFLGSKVDGAGKGQGVKGLLRQKRGSKIEKGSD